MNDKGKKELYTIGEIAKICNVNIRTLHYYDSIDLVKPIKVLEDSNYRLYSREQIPIINSVKRLREIGFSIKRIKEFNIASELPDKISILEKQSKDINREITRLQLKQKRIDDYLGNFKKGESFNNIHNNHSDISIKEYSPKYIAYSRMIGGVSKEDFHLRFSQLSKICRNNNYNMIGSMYVLFHDNYRNSDYEKADVEIFIEVDKNFEIPNKVRLLKGFSGASCYYYGDYSNMNKTYEEILNWIEERNYKTMGKVVEKHIIDRLFTLNSDDFVTEIIIPIK